MTTYTCYICGCELTEGETHFNDCNEYFCHSCYDDAYTACNCCGCEIEIEDAFKTSDGLVCDACLVHHYVQCDRCGKYFHQDDIRYSHTPSGNEIRLCESCYDEQTELCDDCGERFYDPESDMQRDGCTVCNSCYGRRHGMPRRVMGYGYKPEPRFMPCEIPHQMYMGVELEVDSAKYVPDLDDLAANAIDTLGYVYVKHDGSLNNGMEIVTHPATLKYHTENMKEKWQAAIKQVREAGLSSYKVGTCGLHVHVSLEAIEHRDPTIVGKLLLAMDRFWDNFVKFSRRTEEQLNAWAKRYVVDKIDEIELIRLKDMAKQEVDRYVALNLQNVHTIEFRMFRGTLKWDTFVATLQFVQAIIDNLSDMSFQDIQALTWKALVTSDYPELNAYLKKRGLSPNNEAGAAPEQACDQSAARPHHKPGDVHINEN